MKSLLIFISLCFNLIVSAEEITDFNAPLWSYGTGNGADATGAGTLGDVPFTMSFSLNGGSKLFTSTIQHTSNSTLGHGGPIGSLLLGGAGEGLSITFARPVTVTLGLSHVNVSSDGWDFLTPADEIVSLHSEHEVVGAASIDGFRQNTSLGPITTATNNTSYFRWVNVTTINIQTVGQPSTTLALSSMSIASPVPSLSALSLLILIGLLGFVSARFSPL